MKRGCHHMKRVPSALALAGRMITNAFAIDPTDTVVARLVHVSPASREKETMGATFVIEARNCKKSAERVSRSTVVSLRT